MSPSEGERKGNQKYDVETDVDTLADDGSATRRAGLPATGARLLGVEVVGGPMDGERRQVSAAELTIGRASRNDLALNLDVRVSQRHARITSEGRRYFLEDLGSTNGTFIGDERINGRTPIGPGTVFVVGRTPLKFLTG